MLTTIPSCQLKSHLLVLKLAPLWGWNCVKWAAYSHEEINMYEGNRLRMPYLATPLPPRSSIISYVSACPSTTINTIPSHLLPVTLLMCHFWPLSSLPSILFCLSPFLLPLLHRHHPILFSTQLSCFYPQMDKTTTHIFQYFSHIFFLFLIFYQWVAWLLIEMVMSYLDWLSISMLIPASPALIGTLSFWNKVLLPQTNQKVSHCIHLASEPSHTGARKLNLATLRIKWRILTYHLISSIPLPSPPAKLHNSLYYLHPSTHNDLSHFLYSSSASLHPQFYPLLLCCW